MPQPNTLNEIQEICSTSQRLLPVGAGTKSALAATARDDLTLLDMRAYSGIVSYDASEFLVSARGGTTIAELSEALAQHGQYLPFDPVYVACGATLGGSIASGISGPCRMLYGGLRDFMLEVALCDGAGNEVRGGGKVVKNAAGFDLPKLIIGSYGRMGVITEATLKVFPRPQGWLTLRAEVPSLPTALDLSMKLLAQPLPIAGLEIDEPAILLVRLAGPLDSLAGMAARVTSQFHALQTVEHIESSDAELDLWQQRAEFAWAGAAKALVRVALAHHQCNQLSQRLSQLGNAYRRVLSCGGSVAWIAATTLDDLPALDEMLSELQLAGVVIRGPSELTLLGDRRWVEPAQRIQQALDSQRKLLAY